MSVLSEITLPKVGEPFFYPTNDNKKRLRDTVSECLYVFKDHSFLVKGRFSGLYRLSRQPDDEGVFEWVQLKTTHDLKIRVKDSFDNEEEIIDRCWNIDEYKPMPISKALDFLRGQGLQIEKIPTHNLATVFAVKVDPNRPYWYRFSFMAIIIEAEGRKNEERGYSYPVPRPRYGYASGLLPAYHAPLNRPPDLTDVITEELFTFLEARRKLVSYQKEMQAGYVVYELNERLKWAVRGSYKTLYLAENHARYIHQFNKGLVYQYGGNLFSENKYLDTWTVVLKTTPPDQFSVLFMENYAQGRFI
jgi:hypothetical protein